MSVIADEQGYFALTAIPVWHLCTIGIAPILQLLMYLINGRRRQSLVHDFRPHRGDGRWQRLVCYTVGSACSTVGATINYVDAVFIEFYDSSAY
jgi:hypothetical protein